MSEGSGALLKSILPQIAKYDGRKIKPQYLEDYPMKSLENEMKEFGMCLISKQQRTGPVQECPGSENGKKKRVMLYMYDKEKNDVPLPKTFVRFNP